MVTGVAIVRCPRAHHRAVWSAIATITTLQGTPCSVTLKHLGGQGEVKYSEYETTKDKCIDVFYFGLW